MLRHKGVVYLEGCDLLDETCVRRIAHTVTEHFTGPFALIHSVGDFWNHQPLDETPPNVARSQMESHYLTLYTVLHQLLPLMAQAGGGRVIAFSCNSVQQNYPEMAPFTAAKAAIETLIRCVANEYAGCGVQANSVALPTIYTDKVRGSKILSNEDSYVTPEDLADFLYETMLTLPSIVNGSTVKVFKHNRNFYNLSYFERNPSGRLQPLAGIPSS